MAEVDYVPDEYGWFKVSRRLIGSSRWVKGSPAAVKLMLYMLERASAPNNPWIGDVMEVGETLATHASLTREQLNGAITELLSDDLDSLGTKAHGAFIEELTNEGVVVGYRVINFARYNPGLVEGSSARRAASRKRRAMKAALARWGRICSFPQCGAMAEMKAGGTGMFYCLTHAVDAGFIKGSVIAEMAEHAGKGGNGA